MSESMPVAASRSRPATVTAATWLLFLVAALMVSYAVANLSVVGTVSNVTREVYRGTDVEGAAGVVTAVSVLTAALFALFGAAFVLLATFINRGRNPARIVTWVLGGIVTLCCFGGGLFGQAFNVGTGGGGGGNVPDPEELRRRLEDELPSWYGPLIVTITVAGVLVLVTALILLALPPSNAFFRGPQEAWVPPGYPPASGYPPGPGYPPAPGYPPGPGYPPAPGYPPTAGQQPEPGQPPGPGGTPPGPPSPPGTPGPPEDPGRPPV